ncbi:MAG: type VI secretion system ImpA family N-terminal domain-containing protein [Pseudomonadota bacterium]
MELAWLSDPVAADAPCGPDLELSDDDGFLDYYYDAEGRLPERYVTTGVELGANGRPTDRVFDAKAVDTKAERAEIESLLRASRDLRLLSLLARWEALAWNPVDLADAMEAMAAVTHTFGDAAHPALPDRARDRRAALEALCTPAHMLQPLHHLPLTGGRDVTWRRWLVTQGKVEARPGEEDADATAILAALAEPGAAPVVDRVHGSLVRMLAAAQTLNPSLLSPLIDVVEGILALLAQARPDLSIPEAPVAEVPVPPDAPETPAPVVPAPEPVAGEPRTRAEARAALSAVETYLGQNEPSSAALLLVIQARHLIGKPLIEAMETLLPTDAGRAVVDFGPTTGFALSMERLKSLASEIPAPADDGPPVQAPPVAERPQAASQLRAIAAYFRRSEPTSPVPILLDRARGWLERDFEGILAEILPKPPTEG